MRVMMIFIPLFLGLSGCGGKSPSSANSSPELSTRLPASNQTPAEKPDPLKYVELETPTGELIRSSIAYKSADQQKGLSGVRPEDFADDEGKLFFYFSDATRTFWMPNTYFALDIFYLDKDLRIKDIVWDLPWYQGTNKAEIPRAPAINSRHVLEMKSGSGISGRLRIGDQLKWRSSLGLSETESRMKAN